MMYIRYPLSLHQVEYLLLGRGIDICHETVRFWWNSKAALKFLKRAMNRYGRPRSIVTDRLWSYRSAMKVIGNAADQIRGRWLNNPRKFHLSRSDDEKGRWLDLGTSRPCGRLPRFTHRSITI
jgi:transposase-like protein